MKSRLIVLCALVLALTALGCGGVEDGPVDELPTMEGKADFPGPDCSYKCVVCPPTAQRCNLRCTFVGNCHSDCGFVDVCDDGFKWFESACRCLPDVTP
jgi:hypothetical protein